MYSQAYYHINRKNAAPLGKLYQKYRNWKSSLARKSKGNNDVQNVNVYNPAIELEVDVDEEEHIRVLEHEGLTLSIEDKLKHWKGCAASRLNSLKQTSGSSKQIIDAWPMYKDPVGFRLVCYILQILIYTSNTYILQYLLKPKFIFIKHNLNKYFKI